MLPGCTNSDVVQVLEDSGASEFKASDEHQIFREETETPVGLGSEPDETQIIEEESRNSEGHGVEEELNLEKNENGNDCGFSCGNYSENLPSTHSAVNEADLWRISDGEATENVGSNERYLQSDTDMIDAQVTTQHSIRSDDEQSDAGSDHASCVTLENDEEEEKDADKLYSAVVGLDELREGEEKWEKVSVLSINLENISQRNRKPDERPSVSVEEPNNPEGGFSGVFFIYTYI